METKYKSSSFATYSNYIASPIVVAVFFHQLYSFFTGNISIFMPDFFLPFWFWAAIIVTMNIYRLRYIEVREDNILLKSFGNLEILEYRNIEWINQNIFGSNWYILSIKYKDKNGKNRLIFALPEMYTGKESRSILNPFAELNITKYIRERIIQSNPSYDIKKEPSRWYLSMWTFVSLVVVLIISFTFFI